MITAIYNTTIQTETWPALWLTEHVTVIPKGRSPEDPSKCRNISCTNYLSKALERIVLQYARQQVVPKPNQFGGERGCSTDHFLAEVWDQVSENLEDQRAATILTSIDYSKAFNRLDHEACLKAFANKGASTQLVRLLASFLMGRTMTVRVDGKASPPRPVNAGAPQGSVLGTYIFNIGTDTLEDDAHIPDEVRYELNAGDLSFLELQPNHTYAESTPRAVRFPSPTPTSPIQTVPTQPILILPTARNVPTNLQTRRIEPTWRPKPVAVKKFVDDNLQCEKLCYKDIPTYQDEAGPYRNARAGKSEAMFKHIAVNARKQGLLVNAEKTAVLPISGAVSYDARAHIYGENNERIDSGSTLKTLGFIFNKQADVSDQVEALTRRFRSRTWALRDLRKSGLTTDELLTVYKSTIRPVIEYSSVIYHPMLTCELSDYIEKQQARALKNIFGCEHSHRKLLELANIPTLKARREEACLKFARKMSMNKRFESHFRMRKTRSRAAQAEEFFEFPARTNRRYNSPLYFYRRILNESVVRYPK